MPKYEGVRLRTGTKLVYSIEMDIGAYKHSKERVPLFSTYSHSMETVVVQDPVVYAFTAGPISVYIFPSCGSTGDRGI